jgi:hypothetical protein
MPVVEVVVVEVLFESDYTSTHLFAPEYYWLSSRGAVEEAESAGRDHDATMVESESSAFRARPQSEVRVAWELVEARISHQLLPTSLWHRVTTVDSISEARLCLADLHLSFLRLFQP